MATDSPRGPGRKGEILDAALSWFVAQGVSATTIQDVCRASGASVGSIYHHYGSKEGLVNALIIAGLRDNLARLKRDLSTVAGTKASVYAVVASMFSWIDDHRDWARFIYLQTVVPDPEIAPIMAEVAAEWNQTLSTVLEADGGRGRIHDLPMDYLASLLLGPAHDFARRWLAGGMRGELGDHVSVFQEAAWHLVGRNGEK